MSGDINKDHDFDADISLGRHGFVDGSLPLAHHVTVADDEFGAVSEGRIRIRIGAFVFIFMVLLVILRLAETSLFYPKPTTSGHPADSAITRADIVDREGEVLATTLQTYSVIADPRIIWNAPETADALLSVLPDLNRDTVLARLTAKSGFEYIERGLTPKQRQMVFDLGLPGIDFQAQPKRVYPRGQLAAHVLGSTDTELHGTAGAEMAFDTALSASNAPPTVLSIDMRVQHVVSDALAAGITRYNAVGAAGIVMDMNSGELIAMVSLPQFDANAPAAKTPQRNTNHAAVSVYELGSVFKPITMALALETGAATLSEEFPVHKPFKVGSKFIRDDHPSDVPLVMADILAQSSNRGTAMLALRAGGDAQRDLLESMGLFARVPYELPESARPIVQRRWADITTTTVSYGHGLSVTPLALVAATAPLMNGGYYVTPTIMARGAAHPTERRRVLSEKTANDVRDMMRYVVTNGTGRNARAAGYGVMGKTGTADKPGIGGYTERGEVVTSFIAGFPHADPRYVVMITYDSPQAVEGDWGYRGAGWNAAKTTKDVIGRIGPILNVPRYMSAQLPMPATQNNVEGALP